MNRNKNLILLENQKRMLLNRIYYWRDFSLFKIIVVSIFAIIFWLGLFFIFYKGFNFYYEHISADFFELLIKYLFSLFFFALFLMLIFSSTIVAFSSFFYAKETIYLMTLPIPYSNIFFYKFIETFLFSSWAVFFIGLPVCFAYGIHQHVSIDFYFLLILSFFPFICIPALIGSLIAFIITLYFYRIKRILAIIFFGGLIISLVLLGKSIIKVEKDTVPLTGIWFLNILDYFDFALHPLLPSFWMSKIVLNLSNKYYNNYLFYFLLMISNTLFLGLICYFITTYKYGKAWSIAHSTKAKKTFIKFKWLEKLIKFIPFLDKRDRIFLEKDIKIFFRDSLQWSQFAILLGLLLIYILNLRTLKYDQRSIFWKHIVASLNLMATSLTICTFASRFIFPMLSLEGKRFWMLGVMPIKRKNILISKFIFSVLILTITSEVLIILSCYMLRLPYKLTLLNSFTMLGIAIGISGLSVGLGAIYPDFKEDNPAKIVSKFGGTLNLVLNLIFVIFMIFIQFIPSNLILRNIISPNIFYLCIFFSLFFSLGVAFFPIYIGIKIFQNMEI